MSMQNKPSQTPDFHQEIQTVAIIGLGALGVMYGYHLAQHLEPGQLRFIADPDRIARYRANPVTCNGAICQFDYVSPLEQTGFADLVIFAVKQSGLAQAIEAVRHQVGPQTTLLSVMNGLTSEAIIAETYGPERVLLCTAQGMAASKIGQVMTYDRIGNLFIGDPTPGEPSAQANRLARFFDRVQMPYELATDMPRRLWSKFMLNVGVNQVVAFYEDNYGVIQKPGEPREMMVAAMREVLELALLEGIALTSGDIDWWLPILDRLDPLGQPSLRQDLAARRTSEVDQFAGQVITLGRKHGVPTPVNQALYDRIMAIEAEF